MTEIVAEIGLQHDGSLREARDYITAAAFAGVDVVKFQCHQGDANDAFRHGTRWQFPQDASRAGYWRRTGFEGHEWAYLADHAQDHGVEFLCTPFSVHAARLVDPYVKRWKIGSGQVQDHELLAYCYTTNKPIIFSNGFRKEVHYELHDQAALELACISKYPTPPDEAAILLNEVKHSSKWGWSSHTGQLADSQAAIALGAKMVEVHICWSKWQSGPDVESSLMIEQLTQLVDTARQFEREVSCQKC